MERPKDQAGWISSRFERNHFDPCRSNSPAMEFFGWYPLAGFRFCIDLPFPFWRADGEEPMSLAVEFDILLGHRDVLRGHHPMVMEMATAMMSRATMATAGPHGSTTKHGETKNDDTERSKDILFPSNYVKERQLRSPGLLHDSNHHRTVPLHRAPALPSHSPALSASPGHLMICKWKRGRSQHFMAMIFIFSPLWLLEENFVACNTSWLCDICVELKLLLLRVFQELPNLITSSHQIDLNVARWSLCKFQQPVSASLHCLMDLSELRIISMGISSP